MTEKRRHVDPSMPETTNHQLTIERFSKKRPTFQESMEARARLTGEGALSKDEERQNQEYMKEMRKAREKMLGGEISFHDNGSKKKKKKDKKEKKKRKKERKKEKKERKKEKKRRRKEQESSDSDSSDSSDDESSTESSSKRAKGDDGDGDAPITTPAAVAAEDEGKEDKDGKDAAADTEAAARDAVIKARNGATAE